MRRLSGYTKSNIGLNKSYIAGQRSTRPRLAQAALKSLILDPTPRRVFAQPLPSPLEDE